MSMGLCEIYHSIQKRHIWLSSAGALMTSSIRDTFFHGGQILLHEKESWACAKILSQALLSP